MEDKVFNNRYKVLKLIGNGGTATVYQADDLRLKRKVALKILKEEFKNNKIFIERFKNEALSVAKLASPNIVSIYDVGEENGINYIVMEYIDKTSLKNYLLEHQLDENEILKMAVEICYGLIHAHKNKIIHRDIKPHNILINSEGTYKLTDFGIAKLEVDTNLTQTGNIMGSIAYFSPEQAKGIKVDERSDIYSFGVTLYEVSTGKLPFYGENYFSIAYKHVHESPLPPNEINENISKPLNNLILKAMEKDPEKRFQSAESLLKSLSEILNRRTASYQNILNDNLAEELNIDETLFFTPSENMQKIYPNSDSGNIIFDKKPDEPKKQPQAIENINSVLPQSTKKNKSLEDLLPSKNTEIFKLAAILVGVLIIFLLIINLYTKTKSPNNEEAIVQNVKVSATPVNENKTNPPEVTKKSNVHKYEYKIPDNNKHSKWDNDKPNNNKTKNTTEDDDTEMSASPTPQSTNDENATESNDPLKIQVPDLVGKSVEEATSILNKGSYTYRIEHVSLSDQPSGVIYKTSPGAGTPYKIGGGTTIIAYYNRGIEN